MRTNCGLRTVVKILEMFYEVIEGKCGKVPCYNTVENWMKKLGLSVYENERKPTEKKSPNKLYGITPFILFIPLHAKLAKESLTKTFNFKERLCDVKLKDIDAFAKAHV